MLEGDGGPPTLALSTGADTGRTTLDPLAAEEAWSVAAAAVFAGKPELELSFCDINPPRFGGGGAGRAAMARAAASPPPPVVPPTGDELGPGEPTSAAAADTGRGGGAGWRFVVDDDGFDFDAGGGGGGLKGSSGIFCIASIAVRRMAMASDFCWARLVVKHSLAFKTAGTRACDDQVVCSAPWLCD